jgi:hypothetical protein
MTVSDFLDMLPPEMFADSDPDYCTGCGTWECPGHEDPGNTSTL